MQTPLPASFRIGENLEPDLKKRLKGDGSSLQGKRLRLESMRMDSKVDDTRQKEDVKMEGGDGVNENGKQDLEEND